jgi:superfamily II DNA or RNA helicase
MQLIEKSLISEVFKLVLQPLLTYNPYLTLYYNPFSAPPSPELPRKQYFNYIHQIALVLDAIPRRRVRVLIGDEVGLGKTIEAIRIIKYLSTIGEAKRILIIAPRQLINQWLHREIKDLMYARGVVRVLSRRSIEAVAQEIKLGPGRPHVLLAPLDLVKRGSEDRHAHGRFKPYYDLVSSVEWDLVVVDEAHHLGFTSPHPVLRTERLAPLCERAKHLLLLSATPSRGTHKDMLGRITLLTPGLKARIRRILRNEDHRKTLYENVSEYIVYRRTKDFVNEIEGKQVFTRLTSFLGLVKLGEERGLYEELGEFVAKLLKTMDPSAPAILKIIVLKRALSSPHAFLKTFVRVVDNRAGGGDWRRLSDKMVESSPDSLIEKALATAVRTIPGELRDQARELLTGFARLHEEGDPGFKALAHLLLHVASNSSVIPRELKGDYIVFSEYRDTVDYLYDRLAGFFEGKGFRRDEGLKKEVIEKALKEYFEREYVREGERGLTELLNSSITILSRDDTIIFLGRISSQNQRIVYLIPDLAEAVNDLEKSRALKVLVSTDVASEGLNIQEFNIVVNYDVPWSPVRREQRIGRVYRLRQRRDCSVVDLVRESTVEYAFYSKLVLKLLNILEQKLISKPVEGLLELYVTSKGGGEESLVISERTIGEALVSVYEKFYIDGSPVDEALRDAYQELMHRLKTYRDLAEELSTRLQEVDIVKMYVKDLTGCDSHEDFEEIVSKTLEALTRKKMAEPARALRELYDELFQQNLNRELPTVLVVREPGFEEGYLGIVDFLLDGVRRFSTPFLLVKARGEKKVLWGLEVLKWLAEEYGSGRLKPFTLKGYTAPASDSFRDDVRVYANRLNFYFKERLRRREEGLARILGEHPGNVGLLEPVLGDVVVRLVGYQNLEEYEAFRNTLPRGLRDWMEEASINHVAEMYEKQGCRILEKNIHVETPYDLKIECTDPSAGPRTIYVEVKSHLKHVLVAELTSNETDLAEAHPDDYIVCNVMGLENKNREAWTTLCEAYGKLPKTIITETREEKRARIFFPTG